MSDKPKDETTSQKGRPPLYKEEYAELAKNYCLLGATDKNLADFFGVSERTINYWKEDYPEFLQSIKEGKIIADASVANSLYKRATGYAHTDTKFATFEGHITDSKEYIKHYAPETSACIFWLKNRQPELWRDKVQSEISGPDGAPIQTNTVVTPELEKKIAEIKAIQNTLNKPDGIKEK